METDKAYYYFTNLRNGYFDKYPELWTTEKAASENQRVARTMGKHFRYVLNVEESVAEWVEEAD